jgi:hypothetical protein
MTQLGVVVSPPRRCEAEMARSGWNPGGIEKLRPVGTTSAIRATG